MMKAGGNPWESHSFGGTPSFTEGSSLPDERKEGCPMVTYADLFQFCIFIVALVGLVYQIFKDKRK
jgi:hypothetical protein